MEVEHFASVVQPRQEVAALHLNVFVRVVLELVEPELASPPEVFPDHINHPRSTWHVERWLARISVFQVASEVACQRLVDVLDCSQPILAVLPVDHHESPVEIDIDGPNGGNLAGTEPSLDADSIEQQPSVWLHLAVLATR